MIVYVELSTFLTNKQDISFSLLFLYFSLLGGVQLFAMIKMLGLLKQDMSPSQNQWAWYGYQVSMRVLEVTICTLLAVIATTPLRSDPNNEGSPGSNLDDQTSCCCCGTSSSKGKRKGLCSSCFGDSNPPREFEDEIYSEICSNNHSVRQVLANDHYAGANNGTMLALGSMQAANGGPLMANGGQYVTNGGHYVTNGGQIGATLVHQQQPPAQTMLAMGSSTLMPYGHKRAGMAHHAAFATQSATLLRSSNHSYSGAFQVSSSL